MCGIAGIRSFHKEINQEDILRMSKAVHHRGPDDDGIYLDDGAKIALAHRRLSILDPSEKGHQPMGYDGAVIVYNGAVYNFREIRKKLESHGMSFFSDSDTEVVLKHLRTKGIEAVHDFRGMFALALWDSKKGSLTLIRDRAGVKPLYYYFDGKVFLFASQPSAIVAHSHVVKRIDPDALSLYFKLGYIPAPSSIYRNVYKLEPGHYLILDSSGKMRINSYWSSWECYKQYSAREEKSRSISMSKVSAELEHLLAECFNLRMVSDVPVGIFLSGGIDSSLVTALLAKKRERDLKTFSIGFKVQEYNEAEAAKQFAKHLGVEHHEIYCAPEDAMRIVPKLPEIYDEPFGDSSGIVTYLLSQFAREKIKVALSADGGDETFAGYNHYLRLNKLYAYYHRYPWAWQAISTLARSRLLKRTLNMRFANPDLKIKKTRELNRKPISKSNFYLTARSIWPEEDIENLLNRRSSVFASFSERFSRHELEFSDFVSFAQASDYCSYLPDDILVKVDRATMAVSLEGREPLLDHSILEYACILPPNLKTTKSQGKLPLRKILRKYMPAELVERPKHGFTVPLDHWLRKELSYLIHEYLDERKISSEGLFDPLMVNKEKDDFLTGRLTSSTRLWLLIEFELWYEKWMR